MAILVLVMSVMPCTDANAMGRKAKTEISKQLQPQQDNHPDDCSPFCSCSCCAGFSFNHSIFSISILSPLNNYLSCFLPSGIIEVALPIWQPPQLV
jgi:hypothetical protein